jgi:hypothetical protein
MRKIILTLVCIGAFLFTNAQIPFFPVKKLNNWTYVDLKGKEALKVMLEIQNPSPFYDGLAVAQDIKTKKFGYLNPKGEWAIKPIYEKAGDFDKGMAIVHLPCDANCLKPDKDGHSAGLGFDGYTQLIDKQGKIVLKDNSQDPEPSKRFCFSDYNKEERLVVVWGLGLGDYKSMMNRKGEIIGDRVVTMLPMEIIDGLVACRAYFADKDGKKVLDVAQYCFTSNFSEGYTWVVLCEENKDDQNILIDKKGKIILKFPNNKEYQSPKVVGEGVFPVTMVEKEGSYDTRIVFLDLKGKKMFSKIYKDAHSFKNGLAFVKENDKILGYINKTGKMQITIDAGNFDEKTEFGDFTAEGYAFIYGKVYNEQTQQDELILMGLLLKDGQYFPAISEE